MRNGHFDELSPFAHLVELRSGPPSPETLALDADRRKVEAIIATGALDEFDLDERIALAWGIIHRQRGEVH